MKLKTAILALLGATTFSLSAQIAYQGRLTDNTGAPLPDPSYNITFSLWDTATAGTSVWSQTINNVSTVDGRFSVTLGDNSNGANSINTRIKTDHFLQVSVGGTPLLPRQQILAAPRAVVADSATLANSANSLGQSGTKPYIMLDMANDRIGINTETPEADLQIDGTTRLYHTAGYFEDSLQISKNLNGGGSISTLGLHAWGIDSRDTTLFLNGRSNRPIETGSGGMAVKGELRVVGNHIYLNENYGVLARKNNEIQAGFDTTTSGAVQFWAEGMARAELLDDRFRPILNEDLNNGGLILGDTSHRWVRLYARDGSIHTSDRRLKIDIQDLSYGLEEILQIRPTSYRWKSEPEGPTKIGVIAQEIQKIIPEVVDVGDDEDQTLGVAYTDLIPVLINGMQEQQQQIGELKNTNQALEERVKALEQTLTMIASALESQNDTPPTTASLK